MDISTRAPFHISIEAMEQANLRTHGLGKDKLKGEIRFERGCVQGVGWAVKQNVPWEDGAGDVCTGLRKSLLPHLVLSTGGIVFFL